LDECLRLVERVFDVDEIANRSIGRQAVKDYYRQCDRGYRVLHSKEGSLHMALNYDGQFDRRGYYGQAEIVQRHVDAIDANRVLDAGSGTGFNTIFLASKNAERQFTGVDLTESHLAASTRAANGLSNASFLRADYLELPFENGHFDVVFSVESVCQCGSLQSALEEFTRVLRPGGRMIVVDCLRSGPTARLDASLQLATLLVEKTLAVDAFVEVDDCLAFAERLGLRRLKNVDLGRAIAPNLNRLHKMALRFFTSRLANRSFAKAFPPMLLENAICGLLMPFTVGSGAHRYLATAWERE